MPRPKNKKELLDLSKSTFGELNRLIDSLPPGERNKEFTPGTMNRNVRDVLAHLYHWHLLFFDWYEVGMAGGKAAMPADGYTWKTTPALNRWIWQYYQNTDLEEVQRLFAQSHKKIYDIIKRHSDPELFEKKRYLWTGSTSLGSYLVSSTSSHYDWALKLIKKGMKSQDSLS